MNTPERKDSRAQFSESKRAPCTGSLMVVAMFLFFTGCSSGGSGGIGDDNLTNGAETNSSDPNPDGPILSPTDTDRPFVVPSPGEAQDNDQNLELPNVRVSCDAATAEMEVAMVTLFNQFRATARICGTESMPAANALTWNATLEEAAGNHSQDMATQNFFDHTGSNGLGVADRVTGLGYQWSTVSENIAAGQKNSEAAVQAWLDSPGHCVNLMRAASTEFAVACRPSTTAQYDTYWTAVFAAPLN